MATLTPERRGTSSVTDIEIVGAEDGRTLAVKKPKFSMTQEAKDSFAFLMSQLPGLPDLNERIPPTEIVYNKDGACFVQGYVHTDPGHENMASLYNPARFDADQIRTTDDLRDIVGIAESGLSFFRDSLNNPASGLEPGVGWFIELHSPGNYVRGSLTGDCSDRVYLVDCYPMLPSTKNSVEREMGYLYDGLDEIAQVKFGIGLEDLAAIPQ